MALWAVSQVNQLGVDRPQAGGYRRRRELDGFKASSLRSSDPLQKEPRPACLRSHFNASTSYDLTAQAVRVTRQARSILRRMPQLFLPPWNQR